MTPEEQKQTIRDMTPADDCRLQGDGIPLSKAKQKWLNHAYASVRFERDCATNERLRSALTNILAALILVDGE